MILAIANAAARKGGTIARVTFAALDEARELSAEGGDLREWFTYGIQCKTRFDLLSEDDKQWFIEMGVPE